MGVVYAYPWDEITEQQRTARCDEILRRPSEFHYIATRDAYGCVGAREGSADYAPASAVEERRRTIDGERTDVTAVDLDVQVCPCCLGAGEFPVEFAHGAQIFTCDMCDGSGSAPEEIT
jgi:hypothetical protein